MSFTFDFYIDATLSTPLTTLVSRELFDGSTPNSENDTILYLGSQVPGRKARATSNPGTDPITITPAYAVDVWSAGAVVADQVMRPTANNGYKYKSQGAGTAVTEPPSWPTVIGDTVTVDGIVYECIDELHQPDEIVLGATAGELETNTPGAPLNLGTEILSESANKVAVYVRISQGVHPVSTFSDLQLLVTELDEEAA